VVVMQLFILCKLNMILPLSCNIGRHAHDNANTTQYCLQYMKLSVVSSQTAKLPMSKCSVLELEV